MREVPVVCRHQVRFWDCRCLGKHSTNLSARPAFKYSDGGTRCEVGCTSADLGCLVVAGSAPGKRIGRRRMVGWETRVASVSVEAREPVRCGMAPLAMRDQRGYGRAPVQSFAGWADDLSFPV